MNPETLINPVILIPPSFKVEFWIEPQASHIQKHVLSLILSLFLFLVIKFEIKN